MVLLQYVSDTLIFTTELSDTPFLPPSINHVKIAWVAGVGDAVALGAVERRNAQRRSVTKGAARCGDAIHRRVPVFRVLWVHTRALGQSSPHPLLDGRGQALRRHHAVLSQQHRREPVRGRDRRVVRLGDLWVRVEMPALLQPRKARRAGK